MDLAVYIGELLRQQGKLSIPGLGVFSQVRKDGYYTDDRSLFYPPHYETSFEETAAEDSTLAAYISAKKRISVASANYFVEKYINNIKQQAAATDVALDQLGWIRLNNNRLNFKANPAATTYEEEYFGLPALSVNKIWDQLSGFRKTPHVVEEPAAAAEADTVTAAPAPLAAAEAPIPASTPELSIFPEVLTLRDETSEPVKPTKTKRLQEPAVPDETAEPAEPKTAVNVWVLVLIIITVAAIILLALYQYKPGLFTRKATAQTVTVKHHAPDTVVAEKSPDTLQTSPTASTAVQATTDTAVKTAPVTSNTNTIDTATVTAGVKSTLR